MIKIIFEAFIFILPVYVSNGFASLSAKLPVLKNYKYPIDFGKEIGGKRILGKGKTFRGLLTGVAVGTLMAVIQYGVAKNYTFKYVDYFNTATIAKLFVFAMVLSFGALLGDIVKSFVKRRVGIDSGRPWPVFDQLDFIAGSILLGAIIFLPDLRIILTIVIATPLAHLFSNIAAYKLKLKDVWW